MFKLIAHCLLDDDLYKQYINISKLPNIRHHTVMLPNQEWLDRFRGELLLQGVNSDLVNSRIVSPPSDCSLHRGVKRCLLIPEELLNHLKIDNQSKDVYYLSYRID